MFVYFHVYCFVKGGNDINEHQLGPHAQVVRSSRDHFQPMRKLFTQPEWMHEKYAIEKTLRSTQRKAPEAGYADAFRAENS